MVKLTSPCFSLEASGTMAKAVTFAKLGKTAIAKRHFSPSNPRTSGQVAIRAMVKFLTQIWINISDEDKATYNDLAESLHLSPYHAFLKFNCQRWAAFLQPIANADDPGVATFGSADLTATDHGNYYNLLIELDTIYEEPFCATIFASKTTPFTPTRNHTILIVGNFTGAVDTYSCNNNWTPPDSDTYYFKACFSLRNGSKSTYFD